MFDKPLEEEDIDVLIDEEEDAADTGFDAYIVVYNDDHNTFDWVIKAFIDILHHTDVQAEQLAFIIHFKGKATVKTGPKKELKPQKDALTDRGLSAVIEGGEED